uniref:RING-type domain-containing protein n=1 Tax=Kalanchoe fedtschenkoi TaxID=63787 RepID=A0A7N0TKG8_KALFE
MWYLLICDMNISQACTMDGETSTSNNTGNVGPSNENISTPPENKPDSEIKSLVSGIPDPCTPSASTPSLPPDVRSVSGLPNLDKSKKSSVPNKLVSRKRINPNMNAVHKPLDVSGSSQLLASEGKPNCSRIVNLSASSNRELLLVQKTFRLDKFSRAVGHKGVLRAGKISSSAGASFDRKLKSVTHSGGINHRNVSMKTIKAVPFKVPPEHGKLNPTTDQPITGRATGQDSHNYNAQLTLSSSLPPLPLPIDDSTASIPVAEAELSFLAPWKNDHSQVPVGGRIIVLGSSYDESLLNKPFGQLSGSDPKDAIIIKLVPRVHELQSQLEEWKEWANQKVMQAARRLGKDKFELKSLRQEKEEAKKLKRDEQTMDENTLKKLSEMENALSKASGQVEHANSCFQRLEVENADLRRQMEAARLKSAESAANCQEASIREKRTLMEIQSWEKQKNLFQEELVKEKRKSVTIQKELGLAKDVLGQVEARLEQEMKVKEDVKVQASSIRKEIEQAEAMAKSKEEVTKLKAESGLQKFKDDIQKLEREISQLRTNRESFKIAALRRGIGGSCAMKTTELSHNSSGHKVDQASVAAKMTRALENSGGSASVKRSRECVMCLSEEISVVFLPCAHQVVCAKCNELHEKKGMKECPSCRSLIQRRIVVRYAVS